MLNMARVQALQRTAIVAFGGLAVASQLQVRRAYAEVPSEEIPQKKPIYSSPYVHTQPKPSSTSPVSKPNPVNPTPTDRLEVQIRRARLFLHDQSQSAENAFNDFLTWAFKKETNFTNTIASLAPSPATGEQLLPGAIYVLVATMAGSIVARNRNILLRATFPVAVGVTAGWMLIPVTMRNTADLIWEYEKKAPVVADTHLQIRGLARETWAQARERTESLRKWADDSASQSRAKVENWVEKGR